MNRKKLCILMPKHWSAFMGGSQYQAKCLLKKLLSSGEIEIHFLTKQVAPGYRPEGYAIHRIPKMPFVSFRKFYLDFVTVQKRLKAIAPDVIYQRVGCAYTGIAAHYAKRHGCRMVWHVAHDDDVVPAGKHGERKINLDRFNKKLLEYGLRNATAIIAQTNAQAWMLESCFARTPAAVIPNFHPYPQEDVEKLNPVKIVWVANFKPWKQPDQFIRLAADLKKRTGNVECIMIGAPSTDRNWQLELEEQMKSVNVLNYVGLKPIAEVNALLARAHIFVNTSRAEGFANTFVQAWMRRVPVVSLHCNPDGVFEKEKVGFFAGTYEKMLEYVLELIQNPGLRETMADNARNYSYKTHSLRNVSRVREILMA
jgi:glycosyltransferase involved in cell wall biosynthesis